MTSKQTKGYVAAYLTEESKVNLHEWAEKNIPDDVLFYANMDGKIEGGNVTNKAHITLFFGFNNDLVDKDTLNQYLNTLNIKEVKPSRINVFSTPYSECNILIIEIHDEDKTLLSIHNILKRFPHFEEDLESKFISHITVAFIKADFDFSNLQLSNLPKIEIGRIEYRIKN